jgi:hypothetical protein
MNNSQNMEEGISSQVFFGEIYTSPCIERRLIVLEESLGATLSAQLTGTGGGVTQNDWTPDAVAQTEADGDLWIVL